MTIGERIKKLRMRYDISQVELSEMIGISKQSLYKYENGVITNIPSDKIELLADVLHTTPSYLMGWENEQAQPSYYLNPETAAIAQEIFDNPELRALFDVSRNATPDDLLMARDILTALQKRERNE